MLEILKSIDFTYFGVISLSFGFIWLTGMISIASGSITWAIKDLAKRFNEDKKNSEFFTCILNEVFIIFGILLCSLVPLFIFIFDSPFPGQPIYQSNILISYCAILATTIGVPLGIIIVVKKLFR